MILIGCTFVGMMPVSYFVLTFVTFDFVSYVIMKRNRSSWYLQPRPHPQHFQRSTKHFSLLQF